MAAKTQAQRSREYRQRKRAAAKAAGVPDDAPVLDQARALHLQALRQARAGLQKPGTGLVSEAKDAALTAAKVIATERECDRLIPVEPVRAGWVAAMEVFGRRVEGLIRTLPAELVGRDEGAVRDALEVQLRGAFDALHAAPTTWPADLGFRR